MLDFKNIQTYSIKDRKNLVKTKNFPKITDRFVESKDKKLEILAEKIIEAKENNKEIIFMIGGHVIKTGMSTYLQHLIDQKYITHLAMNGSAAIHDFEIGLIGETSEDVSTSIKSGTFGFARETGKINDLINNSNKGFGETLSEYLSEEPLPSNCYSLLAYTHNPKIPTTVHVAIGTDIIHMNPNFDGAKTGEATYKDFKTFTESVSKLEGGVLVNLGSAVIMPEVFLKALSVSRNLTKGPKKFTAANLDQILHYRPTENIVNRPTQEGGLGLNIQGKHQETIPTLYKLLTSQKL